MSAATDNLFLLEFLVDKVIINLAAIKNEFADLLGETCVHFSFLNNGPLDICEGDFADAGEFKGSSSFKSGKSILFGLTPEDAATARSNFKIHLLVSKKIKQNAMPDKMNIGETDIDIVNQFNELLRSLENNPNNDPQAKVVKGEYELRDDGKSVGMVSAFVRMSSFGKLIVTQFQMNVEDRSVLFKDNQGQSMYKYKKTTNDCVDLGITGECKPSECVGSSGEGPQNPNYNPDAEKCYQEIGAEMNGNVLIIRVLKDKKKDDECPGNDDECSCMKSVTAGPKGALKKLTVPPPGTIPGALNFKVVGCNNQAENCISVVPPRISGTGNMEVAEISDPNRDVFILKIGKKREGDDKKNKIELELKTPKGVDRKPPPKLETRDTQYCEADIPPDEEGKGKKGKKGKGKGKGKKK